MLINVKKNFTCRLYIHSYTFIWTNYYLKKLYVRKFTLEDSEYELTNTYFDQLS
jgi:hypothetical protein